MKHIYRIGANIDIIFDGYLDSNTKDHCHRKRNPIQSNNIEFTSAIRLDCRKDLFLSNSSNKQAFINLLTIWLLSAGHVVQHTGDADRLIADRVVDLADGNNVCVHADDTDILVLLISKLKTSSDHSVYLKQENSNRTINLTSLIEIIPDAKKKNILLSHAMPGCDTTSGLFGIGKTKLMKSTILEDKPEYSSLFTGSECDTFRIIDAGEKIILKLYGKHKSESLDELRGSLYKKETAQ